MAVFFNEFFHSGRARSAALFRCCWAFALFLAAGALSAQAANDRASPSRQIAAPAREQAPALKRLFLYSSGVGFFEYRGKLPGTEAAGEIVLSVKENAVNDALKSLQIALPPAPPGASDGEPPLTVSYPSAASLFNTLRSFKVNLLGNPGIAEILRGLQGEDVEISAPNPVKGRIISVEYRQPAARDDNGNAPAEAFLSLYAGGAITVIDLRDIRSIAFASDEINADLKNALDLIMASRDNGKRELRISVPPSLRGSEAVLSYVIPVPVWKVSYRLDLSQTPARFQGWAIIDNDSDTDWDDVDLSLVSGRPVSFIQELYPPYHVFRPTLPLAIAGAAEARSHAGGMGFNAASVMQDESAAARADAGARMPRQAEDSKAVAAEYLESPAAPAPVPASARGAALADQFEFALKQPVTVKRGQSAMVPLVESGISARKLLVFSGAGAARAGGAETNAALAAEITNSTGMKLPAGPITVYDAGAYAGDALIEFLGADDRRLISYGDDLTVTGNTRASGSRHLSAVAIKAGIMTVTRSQIYETVYTLKNASGETKQLVIEHPILAGAALSEPASADERTASLYRFNKTLEPNGNLSFTVREERPVFEQVALVRTQLDSWLSYTANEGIPPNVKAALEKAVELRLALETERASLEELGGRLERLIAEQERVRLNLEAVGGQSAQGQEYLRRLALTDNEIDGIYAKIDEANTAVRNAERGLNSYLLSLDF
ncbi:MAG: DUF4139 domain-containing protein [Treponema sp.]|jgi:hypothetical protein|nr:DUF4139 domain-containing protein [Treponema sp.]